MEDWKYLKDQLRFIEFIRWGEFYFVIILFGGLYLWLGWWGIPIAIIVHFLTANLGGGAVADLSGDYLP